LSINRGQRAESINILLACDLAGMLRQLCRLAQVAICRLSRCQNPCEVVQGQRIIRLKLNCGSELGERLSELVLPGQRSTQIIMAFGIIRVLSDRLSVMADGLVVLPNLFIEVAEIVVRRREIRFLTQRLKVMRFRLRQVSLGNQKIGTSEMRFGKVGLHFQRRRGSVQGTQPCFPAASTRWPS